jgi:hypothetical protein
MHAKTTFAALAVLALTASLPNGAMAAQDGQVGSTSAGQLEVTATSPTMVRITAVNDVGLGNWDGASDLQASDSLCVWSNTGAYALTASGSGPGGEFQLTGGSGDAGELDFTVQWSDQSGAASGTQLEPNNTEAAFQTNATSTTCQGGSALTATVIINIPSEELGAQPSGDYTGTLNLQVAPE